MMMSAAQECKEAIDEGATKATDAKLAMTDGVLIPKGPPRSTSLQNYQFFWHFTLCEATGYLLQLLGGPGQGCDLWGSFAQTWDWTP